MAYRKHLVWSAVILLTAATAGAIAVLVRSPVISADSLTEKAAPAVPQSEARAEQKQGKIPPHQARMAVEEGMKKQDKLYSQQAKAQAELYRQSAERVASQGGDPKPLQNAAAYFEAEAAKYQPE